MYTGNFRAKDNMKKAQDSYGSARDSSVKGTVWTSICQSYSGVTKSAMQGATISELPAGGATTPGLPVGPALLHGAEHGSSSLADGHVQTGTRPSAVTSCGRTGDYSRTVTPFWQGQIGSGGVVQSSVGGSQSTDMRPPSTCLKVTGGTSPSAAAAVMPRVRVPGWTSSSSTNNSTQMSSDGSLIVTQSVVMSDIVERERPYKTKG